MADLRLKKYANTLSKIIQCETISDYNSFDKEKFDKFHNLLNESFPNVFKTFKVKNFHGSLLLVWENKSDLEPILFMSHHDVVEATGDWQEEPFSGKITKDKIWGRGTLDTKGNLWAILQSLEELIIDGFKPNRSIYVESSCNEETTGNGADEISKYLLENKIHFAFSLDEGGMIMFDPIGVAKGNFAMIGMGEKSCIDLKFVARSNGGHASTPAKNSPLVRLAKFVSYVDSHNIFKAKLNKTTAQMFKVMSLKMKGILKLLLGHPYFFKPLLCIALPKVSPTAAAMFKTTIAFTTASGSDGLNVIPEYAYITGNVRVSKLETIEETIATLAKLASKYNIEIEVIDNGIESIVSDFKTDEFKIIEKAINMNFKDVIACPYIPTGASDSRFISRVCDNCYRFAPFTISDEQLEGIHGLNENINLSCLIPAVEFYKTVIKESNNGK